MYDPLVNNSNYDEVSIHAFVDLLLQYPGLSPIGCDVAKKGLYHDDLRLLHSLLQQPLLERYVSIISMYLSYYKPTTLPTSLLTCIYVYVLTYLR